MSSKSRWWDYVWLFLLNAYLLLPVILIDAGALSGRDRGLDKIVLFSLPASLLWLVLAHTWTRRPLFVHALLAPLYVVVAVDLYLSIHYRSRLTSSMLVLVLENWGNASDYLEERAGEVSLAIGALVTFYAVGLYRIRRLVLPTRATARLVAAVAIIALYSVVSLRQSRGVGIWAGLTDTLLHDRSSPFGVFSQSYVARGVYEEAKRFREESASFKFGAKRPTAPGGPEVYLLVIGESSRPDHWGLYGYSRRTTPLLSQKGNLVVVRDAVASAALTQISVPTILTRQSITSVSNGAREKSIVSAVGEVGIKTHWYSTQPRDGFTGAINRYTAEAADSRFFDRERDGKLLEAVRAELQRDGTSKHFFVIHTSGSHSVYADRYPARFEVFPVEGTLGARERLINAYDNSIVYTDYILAELIELLERQNGLAALLYLADHGENLDDDSRHFVGHFLNNEYDLPIPMVFWYSNAFFSRYPDKIAAMASNAENRVSARSAFYTVADMTSLFLDDPSQSRLSLLSGSYTTPVREVFQSWGTTGRIMTRDYDASARGVSPSRTTQRLDPTGRERG